MKHYVNFALLFAFSILVVSAMLRFFEPFSLITTRMHIVFGLLTLILVGVHLASRKDYFSRLLKQGRQTNGAQPRLSRLVFFPALACFYLLGACVWTWWPVPQIISLGYEARNRSIIFRGEAGTVVRSLNNALQIKRQTAAETSLLVEVEWGKAFDPEALFPEPFSGARPQIAIWAESSAGSLIETFFVSEESAFSESFEWAGNERRRVDILPIWRHRYTLVSGVEPDGDIDTYSGATPEHSFSIENYLDEDPEGFYLCLEANLPNDPNDRYHSDQPESSEGYTLPGIGQPSVYYSVLIDPSEKRGYYLMEFVGHGGSCSQQSGDVYYDSSGLTTAHDLVEKILVRIRRP